MSELIKQIKWWETNTQEHHIRGSFNRKLFRDVCNAKKKEPEGKGIRNYLRTILKKKICTR
jgi:hypothetical protein